MSTPSKLTESSITNEKRNELLNRNLYSPTNVYDISNPQIVKAINTVVGLVTGSAFNLRNTLLGRVGGLVGLDTPLAQIGARALLEQWGKRMLQNILRRQRTVKNTLKLDDADPLLTQNNKVNDMFITTGINELFDYDKIIFQVTGGLVGFNSPINRNTSQYDLFTKFTNKGVQGLIKTNLNRNMYSRWTSPNINNRNISFYLEGFDNREIPLNGNYTDYLNVDKDLDEVDTYGKLTNPDPTSIENHLSDPSLYSNDNIRKYDFGVGEKENSVITYGETDDSELIGRRGLLYYTSKIARDTDFGRKQLRLDTDTVGNKQLSRGSNVKCRVFHKLKQYDKWRADYNTLIRLDGNGVEDSVARDFVVPKIHPHGFADDYKRFMLSIENLAYTINDSGIAEGDPYGIVFPDCEIGPNRGRLMWFPPYDIQFDEGVNVNWNSEEFIGRPEKVYTYNNSERTATLSFKLIIDYVKDFTNDRENIVEIIAGCRDSNNTSDTEANDDVFPTGDTVTITENVQDINGNKFLSYFFPNDVRIIENNYEILGTEFNPVNSNYTNKKHYKGLSFGLNKDFESTVDNIVDEIKQNIVDKGHEQFFVIEFQGSASKLASEKYNLQLSKDRISALENYLKNKYEQKYGVFPNLQTRILPLGESEGTLEGEGFENINLKKVIRDRYARFKITATTKQVTVTKEVSDEVRLKRERYKKFINRNIEDNDCGFKKNTYEGKFQQGFDKIDYFSPAFHSQTPEDFHKRLTFLQQCTKTGSNLKTSETNFPSNVVFGKPPFCILRLGDFIHTKMLMTSLNIDYEENTWDLNPEGMGVQFWVANVSMNIVLFGGQSLKWAIERIQNAFDFNYYANSTFPKVKNGYYNKAIDSETIQTRYNSEN